MLEIAEFNIECNGTMHSGLILKRGFMNTSSMHSGTRENIVQHIIRFTFLYYVT